MFYRCADAVKERTVVAKLVLKFELFNNKRRKIEIHTFLFLVVMIVLVENMVY